MKNKIILTLPIIAFVTLLTNCRKDESATGGMNDSSDVEIAMYVVALSIVDDETGIPVRISGINFKDNTESIREAYRSANPLSRTSSRKFSSEEGIALASWIGPISSPGTLEITSEGYDPVLVHPIKEETHMGGSSSVASGDLKSITRTITMKRTRSEQAAPRNR